MYHNKVFSNLILYGCLRGDTFAQPFSVTKNYFNHSFKFENILCKFSEYRSPALVSSVDVQVQVALHIQNLS